MTSSGRYLSWMHVELFNSFKSVSGSGGSSVKTLKIVSFVCKSETQSPAQAT